MLYTNTKSEGGSRCILLSFDILQDKCYTKPSMNIGTYILGIRKSKGAKGFWSLRSVAKRAGISDSYLSQLETGQVKQPLPQILKKLSTALRHSYEDLLCAAGYLGPKKKSPDTIEIPVFDEIPKDFPNVNPEKTSNTITLSYNLINTKNCFSLKVKGDYLRDCGISDKDIAVICHNTNAGNGDIVIARVKNKCMIKRFYKIKRQGSRHERIILQHCNSSSEPIIFNPKGKDIEILGKVILVLKPFN